MGDLAGDIIKRQEQLAGERSTWESHWQEVADRVLPRHATFTKTQTPGAKNSSLMFDATASLALNKFTAAYSTALTPENMKWHRLRHRSEELNENDEVQRWFDVVNKILWHARYSPEANFASQQQEVYTSLGAFGTGVLLCEDLRDGIGYKAIHLGECFISENARGQIDTNYRKFKFTARQALQKWGAGKLPEKLVKAAETEPERKFEFIHAVYPRADRKRGRIDKKNKAFASCYVCVDEKALIAEGGFDAFPYLISRFSTAPNEVYGRGPAMMVLPDIKMLNEMSKTTIEVGHMVARPALLAAEEGIMGRLQLIPGGVSYGGIDEQGRRLVQPLNSGGQLPITLEMEDQRRRVINDAFWVTLFQILTDQPNMTATEAMMRANEKASLLGPAIGRQQHEALGPMIELELIFLARNGRLPPMPRALADAGGIYDIEYDSPVVQAINAGEGIAMARSLEQVEGMAKFDPSVVDNYDFDYIARAMPRLHGAPMKMLRKVEDRDRIREQRAQASEVAAAVEAAPQVAGALEQVTRAGKNVSAARGPVQ